MKIKGSDAALAGQQSDGSGAGGEAGPGDGPGPVTDSKIATDEPSSNGGTGGNSGTGDSSVGGSGGSATGGSSAVDSGSGGSGGSTGGASTSDASANSGSSAGGGSGTGSGGSAGSGIAGNGGTGRDAALDVPPDVPAVDASGTCSADKECPSQSPICLGNGCAKCAGDSDCAGRPGPACAASGFCVACTANKHCIGAAATCDTATNQCVGCVNRNDCAGACQMCAGGVCTAVKGMDDPGFCAGTCDSAGACKRKQGQTCQTATDCAGGLLCVDGYCCNSACSGSCQACNVATSLGTCTTLAENEQPHSGHPACTATDPGCTGSCQGGAACAYPTSACGTASCTASGSYQAAGTCNNGACAVPIPQVCASGKYCTGGACVTLVADGGTCQSSGQCASGNCSNSTCCAAGLTGCSGACVSLSTSNTNCGSCGRSCATGSACLGGSCALNDGQACSAGTQCLTGICRTFYLDSDGDGYGTGVGVSRCGSTPPAGYADKPGDCCDTDRDTNPDQTGWFRLANKCGSFDYDCEGHEVKRSYGPAGPCTPICMVVAIDDCEPYAGVDCTYYDTPACGQQITQHQKRCYYQNTGHPETDTCHVNDATILVPNLFQECN
jgi:hypothetical protein